MESPGNVAAVRRLLQAVADVLGDGAAPDPLAPKPDLHGTPRVPSSKAYIAQATSRDIASGRVRP